MLVFVSVLPWYSLLTGLQVVRSPSAMFTNQLVTLLVGDITVHVW